LLITFFPHKSPALPFLILFPGFCVRTHLLIKLFLLVFFLVLIQRITTTNGIFFPSVVIGLRLYQPFQLLLPHRGFPMVFFSSFFSFSFKLMYGFFFRLLPPFSCAPFFSSGRALAFLNLGIFFPPFDKEFFYGRTQV